MKTKLTLYLPVPVIRKAKGYARRRKVTLSSLVEKHLNQLADGPTEGGFVARWAGQFAPPAEDPSDPRLAHLLRRHVK